MHKNISLFLFFSIVFIHASYPQANCDKRISGRVVDIETGEPLPYVSVKIEETNTGTATDEVGNFIIEHICEDEVHLEFSFLGYKNVIHHHDFHHKIPTIYMAEENLELEGVVVEGDMVLSGTKTLKPEIVQIEDLQRYGLANMADLADEISGLSTVRTGQNIQKPTLHGLTGNRILLLQQGIRYEYQNWGDDHAPGIDPNASSSVEVIKGAATVKYGPEAMGGVLIFNPPELKLHQDLSGKANISGESNGRSANGSLRLQQGFDHWSVMLGGSGVFQGDLKTPVYHLTNTGKRAWNMGSGIRYHKANLDVIVHYNHNDQQLGILRGSVTGNLEDLVNALQADRLLNIDEFSYQINTPRQEITHDMASVEANIFRGNQLFNLKYSWQMNQRQEYDIRRGANNEVPSINLKLITQTLDWTWDHADWKGIEGELGLSWLYHNNDNIPGTNTIPFLPNYNDSRFGIFMVESKQTGKHTFEAGIRYDLQFTSVRGRQLNNDPYLNDLKFNNLTASLGYRYGINEKISYNTNLGTSWRTPSVSELYGFGKHGAIIQYGLWRYLDLDETDVNTSNILSQSDKRVANETGWKWLNQLSFKDKKLQWMLNGYLHIIENYIYATPRGITTTTRGAFPYFIYRQTNALIAGFDADLSYQINDQMMLRSSSSYVYSRDIKQGNYFVEIPPLNFNGGLSFETNNKVFKQVFTLDLSYTFRKFLTPRVISPDQILTANVNGENLFQDGAEIFDFREAPEGYFLTDIGWQGSWRNYILGIQVENLLNDTYRIYTDRIRYFAPDTGINLSISLKYQW